MNTELLDNIKKKFKQFKDDPFHQLIIKIRRKRAEQVRQLLSNQETVDVDMFNTEVWQGENKTYLNGQDITHSFFEFKKPLSLERIKELENALDVGKLEIHGNSIWGSATKIYLPKEKDKGKKLENIKRALLILNNIEMSPLKKVYGLLEILGFGGNISTGLVMVFHPNDFAMYNKQSKELLEKWGYQQNTFESFQIIAKEVKETLGAEDFLELDWFFYLLNNNRLTIEILNFWWVCQGDSYTEDRGKKFLWAPKKDKQGKVQFHWENLSKVKKGDIIFNYSNGFIQGVSLAKDVGYDFSNQESTKWDKEGIRIDIEHYVIDKISLESLQPYMEALKSALEKAPGPFNIHGNINQGYLFEFNFDAAKIIREIYAKPFPPQIEQYFPPGPILPVHDNMTLRLLKIKKQIILYGPPGTGKTFNARKIAESILREK